jgi:formylmethanofuran dehydrogenase subunit B
MAHARINGRSATLEAAVAEAARLLKMSRLPVVAGLGTDIAGARAAIALAQALGGVIDHMHADALLRDLDVMREARAMVTTPSEASIRSDTVLLVGAGLAISPPEFLARLFDPSSRPETGGQEERRIWWLGAGRGRAKPGKRGLDVRMVDCDRKELPALLAALRAKVGSRPVGKTRVAAKMLDALTADLQAARFGVAIWSSTELDTLAIEMLCGLVADLNARTRFSGLPLVPEDNAWGVLQACGWTSGFPMRTGFGRGYAEHDPWRFDAARLIESGEADCALWVSAYRATAPAWKRALPVIALTGRDAKFRAPPRVHIEVGRPGIDHDAVEYRAAAATLVSLAAAERNETISVADALARITLAVQDKTGRPC